MLTSAWVYHHRFRVSIDEPDLRELQPGIEDYMGQFRAAEHRAVVSPCARPELRPDYYRFIQVGILESGVTKVGTAEVGTAEIRGFQTSAG